MNQVLFYLLQVIAASGLLYGYYHFALRNKRFHRYNRFYLVMAFAISSLIPFLNVPVYFSEKETESSVMLQTLQVISSPSLSSESPVDSTTIQNKSITATWFTTANIIYLFYLFILSFFLIRLFISLYKIRFIIKKNPVEQIGKIKFINTDVPGTPFSFFRWLFWNRKIELHSEKGEQIFRHELFHIQQKHSWDIIFMEFISTLFWINPFFHLIKKELKAIHEFLADEFAIKENTNWQYAELLLMQALNTNNHLVNPFFHNQIKRRIVMITSSQKPNYKYIRKLMVLPVTVIIILLFAFNYKSNPNDLQKFEHAINTSIDKKLTDQNFTIDTSKQLKNALIIINGVVQEKRGIQNIDTTKFANREFKGSVNVSWGTEAEKKYGKKGKDGVIEFFFDQYSDPIIDTIPKVDTIYWIKDLLPSAKKSPTQAQLDKWKDAKMYGVWLDGKRINNSELIKYKPSDFGWYNVSKLEKNAINYGKHYFQVNLYSQKYYDEKIAVEETVHSILIGNVKLSDTTKPNGPQPLIVIDGKVMVDLELKDIDNIVAPSDIERIDILKNKSAIDKYGDKAKNGVIEISTKKITVREITLTEKKYGVDDDNKVFEKVEIEASFPGGVNGWREFLQKNLKSTVPVDSGASDGTYTVITQFIVHKDGSISNLQALTSHGHGMEDEVLRVMKKSPNWIPAMQNGHKVAAYRKQPVTFVIAKVPKISVSRYSDAPIYPYLINSNEGTTINLADLKKVNQLKLQKNELVQNCELVSFKITIAKPNPGNANKKDKEFVITGNSFSSELLKTIDDLDSETIIILEDIKVKVDNIIKKLPPRIYQVNSITTAPD